MTPPRIFRLFVSSTFSDFIAEREALQKHVFPDLENYCAERGSRFQAVDLRWGITEEAQRDRETLQICLEEVRRCQELSPRPNFAILLGHRYGWEPLPERISEDHWERLVKQLEELGAAKDKTALEKAYRADTNAVPPTYCLKSGDIEFDELEVQEILRRAAAHFVGSDRLPYFGSATHQEIAAGALGVQDASEHVHAYIRRIKNPPTDSSATNFIDSDDSAVQRLDDLEKELRDQLAEDHLHEFDCVWNGKTVTHEHLKNFCDKFYQHQVALIDQELDRIKRDEAEQTTSSRHHAFAQEQTEIFVGRESLLDQISEYLRSPAAPRSPLIATAEGGAGKTSIMAQSYLQAAAPLASISPVVLCRFIGGVAGVESLKGLLDSLLSDVNAAYGVPDTNTNQDVDAASTAFKAALDHATTENPLWIFIDALDQLEKIDNLPLSDWLPETLPAAVRLVLSARREALPAAVLDNANFNVIKIDGMALDEADTLLSRWLASSRHPLISAGASLSHGRTLTSKQRNLILGRFKKNPNPLWLKLAYEEARRWCSWGQPKTLAGTVTEMVERFIGNHLIDQRKHPPIFTRKALSYIAAGRYGLSEEEIAKALGTDSEVREEFEDFEKTPTKWESEDQLPPILWSRLFLDLRPYLTSAFTDGTLVFRYFHREFKETIERLYSEGEEKTLLHNHLAEVFSKPAASDFYQQTDASGQSQDSRAMRRIMEQPWQLARAGQGARLRTLLMDFSFCMAKCAANRSADLLSDLAKAREQEPIEEAQWRLWTDYFLGQIANLLSHGDQSWPAHRILCQLALEHSDDSPLTKSAELYFEAHQAEWLCCYLGNRPSKGIIGCCRSIMSIPGVHGELPVKIEIISSSHLLSWVSNDLRLWDFREGRCLLVCEKLPDHILRAKEVLDGSALCILSDKQYLICLETGRISRSITEDEAFSFLRSTDLADFFADLAYRRELKENKDTFELTKLNLDEVATALSTINGFDSCIDAKYLSDDRILSRSEDGVLRLWDGFSGELLSELKGHKNSQITSKMLSDGRLISWDSSEEVLRIWSIESESARLTHNWDPNTSKVLEMPDGRIFTYSESGRAMIWDPSLTRPISILDGHSRAVSSVELLKDGSLVTSSSDATIRHWAPHENGQLSNSKGHSAAERYLSAVELPDGRILSWAGKKFIFWDGTTLNHLSEFETPHLIFGVKILNDGMILFWSPKGDIRKLSNPDEIFMKSELRGYIYEINEVSDKEIINVLNTDGNSEIFSLDGKKIKSVTHGNFKPANKHLSIFDRVIKASHTSSNSTAILNTLNQKKIITMEYEQKVELPSKSITLFSEQEMRSVLFSESARKILFLKDGSLIAFSGLHRISPKKVKYCVNPSKNS